MRNGAAVEARAAAASGLFFGHPLLDMVGVASEGYLASYGIRRDSVELAKPEQMPVFSALLASETTVYHAGGAAMNTARTMKWLCPEIQACVVGGIGSDAFCGILKGTLDAAGLECLFEVHEEIPTGTCASLVVQKERAMLANLGAATQLSLEHMKSLEMQRAITRANLFYMEGFFLNTVSSPDNILLVAEHACREDKLFCFNLNAPYISEAFGDRVQLLLPYTDILFGCKDDFLALGAVMWGDEVGDCIKEILMRLACLPKKNASRPCLVVCTCGAENTFAASKNGVSVYAVPEVDYACIVDATGAGDAFAGGFLAQYISHPNVDLCVEAGHASAAVVLRHWGASFSGPPPRIRTPGKNTREWIE
ncbi:putative adenosine kinase [Trypanosoma conorhini]|uniref:Adenosine kinase n=1 Tax=Trypanosoma conorhini TaxID=83891 RepID=A0A3R7MK35_9TRYP|nr:putative adenosine kinase [Trypanosoma conorhini]RNF16424.1 putative adenosine kinase [Trypanosoma conorhini]